MEKIYTETWNQKIGLGIRHAFIGITAHVTNAIGSLLA